MQRNVSATVVAVVGDAAEVVARADTPNVRTVTADRDREPLDRAVAAWREAVRSNSVYVVHDADPLAAVADAWVARSDGVGTPGDLEVATGGVRAAWRQRQVDLPDYYLVVDPDGLSPTRRHWYLGVLLGAAPHRVVPVEASATAVLSALRRLPAGRWWPDLGRFLEQAIDVVPDRFEPATDETAPGRALIT